MKSKPFSERLELLINQLSHTKNSFADAIGIPATSIYNYTGTRGSDPSHGFYKKVKEKFPNVDMNVFFDENWHSPSFLNSEVSEPEIDYSAKIISLGETVKIPIFSMQAAANAIQGVEQNEPISTNDVMELPKWMVRNNGFLFGIRIKGSSMDPLIYDGNVVVFRKLDKADWRNFTNNHVHMVYSNSYGCQVKFLRRSTRDHRAIVLDSENPSEPSVILDVDEITAICDFQVNIGMKVISTRKQVEDRIQVLETGMREILFEMEDMKRKLPAHEK